METENAVPRVPCADAPVTGGAGGRAFAFAGSCDGSGSRDRLSAGNSASAFKASVSRSPPASREARPSQGVSSKASKKTSAGKGQRAARSRPLQRERRLSRRPEATEAAESAGGSKSLKRRSSKRQAGGACGCAVSRAALAAPAPDSCAARADSQQQQPHRPQQQKQQQQQQPQRHQQQQPVRCCKRCAKGNGRRSREAQKRPSFSVEASREALAEAPKAETSPSSRSTACLWSCCKRAVSETPAEACGASPSPVLFGVLSAAQTTSLTSGDGDSCCAVAGTKQHQHQQPELIKTEEDPFWALEVCAEILAACDVLHRLVEIAIASRRNGGRSGELKSAAGGEEADRFLFRVVAAAHSLRAESQEALSTAAPFRREGETQQRLEQREKSSLSLSPEAQTQAVFLAPLAERKNGETLFGGALPFSPPSSLQIPPVSVPATTTTPPPPPPTTTPPPPTASPQTTTSDPAGPAVPWLSFLRQRFSSPHILEEQTLRDCPSAVFVNEACFNGAFALPPPLEATWRPSSVSSAKKHTRPAAACASSGGAAVDMREQVLRQLAMREKQAAAAAGVDLSTESFFQRRAEGTAKEDGSAQGLAQTALCFEEAREQEQGEEQGQEEEAEVSSEASCFSQGLEPSLFAERLLLSSYAADSRLQRLRRLLLENCKTPPAASCLGEEFSFPAEPPFCEPASHAERRWFRVGCLREAEVEAKPEEGEPSSRRPFLSVAFEQQTLPPLKAAPAGESSGCGEAECGWGFSSSSETWISAAALEALGFLASSAHSWRRVSEERLLGRHEASSGNEEKGVEEFFERLGRLRALFADLTASGGGSAKASAEAEAVPHVTEEEFQRDAASTRNAAVVCTPHAFQARRGGAQGRGRVSQNGAPLAARRTSTPREAQRSGRRLPAKCTRCADGTSEFRTKKEDNPERARLAASSEAHHGVHGRGRQNQRGSRGARGGGTAHAQQRSQHGQQQQPHPQHQQQQPHPQHQQQQPHPQHQHSNRRGGAVGGEARQSPPPRIFKLQPLGGVGSLQRANSAIPKSPSPRNPRRRNSRGGPSL